MSLKKNSLANYVSQFSLALIGALMMPMYIKYMGAESYGLIGFYIMLQAWTQLLDMGMTPTLIRETARYRGGDISLRTLRQLIRTIETVFFCFSVCAASTSFLFSRFVANKWLNVENLPLTVVQFSINLIVIAVILRWISSLYRGIVTGFEELIWLSSYNIAIATARFVFVLPVLLWIDNGPATFFIYQLFLSIVEIALLKIKSRRLYHQRDEEENGRRISFFNLPSLQNVLKFSTTIAFTASAWAIVTQSDKLILSRMLSLKEYAYFTLAAMASNGIPLIGNAAGTALMPRLSKLSAENKKKEIIILYRLATKYVSAVAVPATLSLSFFSEQVLFVWIGDSEIANHAKVILSLYTLGNGLLVFNAFPYYLQYANGNLRLHLIGTAFFLLFFLPMLVVLSLKYGVSGAGWSWLAANSISFIIWITYLHKQLCPPNMHLKWLFHDIGVFLFFCLPAVVAIKYFMVWPTTRIHIFFLLAIISAVLLCCAFTALYFSLKAEDFS